MPSETQVLLDILEGLSRAIRELVDILRNARRVQEGDYVLTTDITDIMQAIDKMIEYNDNMLQLLLRLNYEPPAYIVTYMDRVKELRSQLHEPLSGDIVDAYQWATVTEILRIEYEVLTGLLEMQDILFTHEQISIAEQIAISIVTLHSWLQYHHDVKHTGYTEGNSIIYIGNVDGELVAISTSGTELWRAALSGSVDGAPVVTQDGTIYVTTSDGYIYAVDGNGNVLWRFNIGHSFNGSPAVSDNGIIIVPDGWDTLYSLFPNGTLNWSIKINNELLSSPIIGSDGYIYISTYETREVTADSTYYVTYYGIASISMDGSIMWVDYEGATNSPGEFSDTELVVGTKDGFIKFYDKASNRVSNSYSVCNEVVTATVIAIDNTVYVGCSDSKVGFVYGYGSGTTFAGSTSVDGAVYGVPAATPSNKVIFGTENGTLYIVDNASQTITQVSLAAPVYRPVAVGVDETIYVAVVRAILYAVSSDGTIKWQYSFGGASNSAPTLI